MIVKPERRLEDNSPPIHDQFAECNIKLEWIFPYVEQTPIKNKYPTW